ncbi:hypothetical protein HKX48_000675 [Thoreauomyces humboldtii]|nr:hypothetical protein HKX48_000675 [Thoreauomyces humboldtii]
MAVYLVEVVILGAIGSLYQTQEVTTLKASGTLPLYRPYQSTAVTSEFAFEANAAASEAFFNFAKLYDPTSVQGTDPAESCTPWNMSSVTGSVASCSSVLTHPLTVPSVTFAGHTKPNPMTWTTLAEGDVVKSRATEIFTSVSCEQSDAIFTDADPFDDSANNLHLLFNTTDGQTVSGTDPLYAVQLAYFETPQVQVITLGTGAILEDPVFDENGAMLFVMMAWNFPSYPGWTEMKIRAYSTAWSDHPIEVRTVGVALCRASVALGTTNAEYTVLQSSPSTVVKLDKTARDEDTPKLYSMDNTVNIFGPSMGIMIVATLYIFTCDFLTCQPSGTDPPYFVTTIGLLGSEILPNGTTVYTPDLQNVTQGMSRLIARILPAFTTSEYNSSDMASALTTTFAEVWEKESTAQIFTTPACNVILAIGIACAGTLILLHVVQTVGRGAWRLDRSAIWTTSSVYLLLQALPSVAGGGILPNVTRSEWRAAGLDQLRDAANAVNVKGNIDARGKMRLKMTGKDGNTLGRRVAGKAGGKLEGTKGPTVDASKSIKVASLEEEQQLPDLL